MRKTVTVVFCDLVGSTALGQRTDPEVLRELMAGYHAELRSILERHGGTVENRKTMLSGLCAPRSRCATS